jgi:hypothetical protein
LLDNVDESSGEYGHYREASLEENSVSNSSHPSIRKNTLPGMKKLLN